MNENNPIQLSGYSNLLSTKDAVSLNGYLATYKSRIAQESEELFRGISFFPYSVKGISNTLYLSTLSLIPKVGRDELTLEFCMTAEKLHWK